MTIWFIKQRCDWILQSETNSLFKAPFEWQISDSFPLRHHEYCDANGNMKLADSVLIELGSTLSPGGSIRESVSVSYRENHQAPWRNASYYCLVNHISRLIWIFHDLRKHTYNPYIWKFSTLNITVVIFK